MAEIALVRHESERSSWLWPAPLRRRGLVLFVGSTLYVAIAAVRSTPDDPRRAWMAGLAGLALAWIATRPPLARAEAEGATRSTRLPEVSYATWGLALSIVSLAAGTPADGGPARGGAWLQALGSMGACIAAIAACSARGGAAKVLGVGASLPPPKEAVRVAGALVLGGSAVITAAASVFPAF